MKEQRYALVASVSAAGTPEAVVVGVAVTDAFEIVFDKLKTTRKAKTLRTNPAVAFVIGGSIPGDERTVHYEGDASFPEGAQLARIQAAYFAAFPSGRSRSSSPGIAYVRVMPRWLRSSDYNSTPAASVEITF